MIVCEVPHKKGEFNKIKEKLIATNPYGDEIFVQ